ncbi:MAG: DUF1573 domain-containing protein [bacterium]
MARPQERMPARALAQALGPGVARAHAVASVGAVALALALALSLALSLALAPQAGAAVLAEETDIDLGFIYRDEPQQMTFPIRNVSGDTLHIFSIEPSCDCTTAQVVPEALPPQAQGNLLVFFDPMGYEGRGKVKESVRLHTSDRQTPEVLFTFAIEVGVGPEPEPRSLTFGQVAKGDSDTLRVTIRPGKSGPLKIVGARGDSDKIAVKQLARTPEGLEQVAVAVTNKAGGGQLAGFVTLETADTLKPEIRIPVTASLLGNISVMPDVIAFGPTLPGKALTQTVRVFSTTGLKFGVASVTSSLEQIAFEVKPAADGSHEITIKVKDGAAPGRVTGEIKVAVDRPDEPPLTVKVTGHVRSVK